MSKKIGPTREQIIKAANKDGCAHWGFDLARAVEKNVELAAKNERLENELADAKILVDNYNGDTLADKIDTAFGVLHKAVTVIKCRKCDNSNRQRYMAYGLCPECAEEEIERLYDAAEPILPYFEEKTGGVVLPWTQDEMNELWKAVDRLGKVLEDGKR